MRFLFTATIILVLVSVLAFGNFHANPSPELSFDNSFGTIKLKGKALPASCAYTLHGSSDEYSSCSTVCPGGQTLTGTRQCAGACNVTCPTVCVNGAVNYPSCNICSNNLFLSGGVCGACGNGGCTNNVCNNGAANAPTCTTCPLGYIMNASGICTYTQCSVTNACGQSKAGVFDGVTCNASDPSNLNTSCIASFTVSTDRVSPDGSVEFSWSIPSSATITPRCGFVDLTTPTPRPIPGLQNLDPNTDKIKITNIQETTRFCILCQFYNTISGDFYGNAQAHQWVRVTKIGEN